MKKAILKLIVFTIFFIFYFRIVSAAYLTENGTWQGNLTGVFWASQTWGDIDKDNNPDLILIGCTSGTCTNPISKVYINNGSSMAENSVWEANLTSVYYGSVALGDVDNDGDLDLALSGCTDVGCGNGFSGIYINNGSSFVQNNTWKGDIPNVLKSSIAFGDINLDGKLDIALTGAGSVIGKIYINNGTGFAENSTWQQELAGVFAGSTTLVDIDNDNDLDLTLVGDGLGAVGYSSRVYLNNGSSFERNTTWDQNLIGVEQASAAWGDYDNDGDMDLTIMGHTSSDEHEIYNNTGTTLIRIQNEDGGLTGSFEGTQVFGDYDNDGDLDLLISGEEKYTTLHLYNDSTGLFTLNNEDPESHLFNADFGPTAAWVDIDNDLDLDLSLIGHDYFEEDIKAKVYINNITTNNTAPNSPTNFTDSYLNNQLTLTWDNASDNETPVLGLYYNLRVGTSNGTHDIVSGVYGGGDDNGYFGNMMQRKSITLNVDLDANQTVYWAVQTIDTGLKAGNWSAEQNYTLPIDTTTPVITLNAPVNNFNTTNPVISFNATVYDDINLTNVSLFGNWSGSLALNETNSSGINDTDYIFIKNISSYGDGVYSWLIEAKDASNNSINSSIRIFRIDTTYPNITFALNGTTLNNSYFVFNFSATEVNPKTTDFCWYNITNSSSQLYYKLLNLTDFTQNSSTYTYNRTLTAIANNDYNVTINCTDPLNQSTQTVYSFTLNDTTMPGITYISASSSGTTTVTVTLSVTTDEAANCRYSTSNVNYSSMSAMSTGNLSHSVSNQYTSDTSGTYYARCNDTAGNVMNYSNSTSYNADVQEPQVSIGGGGSGLTTAPTAKYYATHFWSSISEDSPADFKINEEKISMTKIKISVANKVKNAEISVTKLDKKPENVEELDRVYQYIEIIKENIKDEDISNAVIEFKVEKEWLLNNSADENDVILNRYTTSWEELTTSKISSDEKYVYYKATTPSFSYFAVAVKKKIVEEAEEEKLEEEDILPPEEVIEGEEEFAEEGPIEEKKSKDWIWFLISALIVVGIIGYFYIKKRK